MKIKSSIINVICGWCGKEFPTSNQKSSTKEGESSYPRRVCLNCWRVVNSSRKESTGSLVGRKHIHSPNRNGDIV